MDSLLGGEVYHWHHKMMLKHARSHDGEPGGSFRWHQVSETPAVVSLSLSSADWRDSGRTSGTGTRRGAASSLTWAVAWSP